MEQKSLRNTGLQYEFVTSHWHLLRMHARLYPCIHDASGQRDAADQIPDDRLPVSQGKNTGRIWWSCYAVLDLQFCNSWTVAAVWIPGWLR